MKEISLFALSKPGSKDPLLEPTFLQNLFLPTDLDNDLLGATPLHYLCFFSPERIDLAQELLEQGADLNALDGNQQTPLHYLALSNKNSENLARTLLLRNADPEICDKHQKPPFYYALRTKNHGVFHLLNEYQEKRNLHFLQQFFEAPDEASLETVQRLVPNGVERLFYQSLIKEDPAMLQRLETMELDLNKIFYEAIADNNIKILEKLLDLGLDPLKEELKVHPLHYAYQMGATNFIEYYLAVDRELLYKRGPQGESALHFASLGGQSQLVSLLLHQRFDPNQKDHHERTPLDYASLGDHRDTIQLLLNQGADHSYHDSLRKNPQNYLDQKRDLSTKTVLIQLGLRPRKKSFAKVPSWVLGE